MSFKREGSDPGLLKNLQHKRVCQILGDIIPDDEALLLSNGRLTCTICPNRPIFDTIHMLSLHRKGKNHLYELSCYLQQRRNSEYRKSKQMQRQFLRTGRLSTAGTGGKNSLAFIARSLTQPTKFSKSRTDRKFVLDMSETCKMKNILNAPIVTEKSANSQVRHYLKSLSKKRPLERTVEEQRSRYPDWVNERSETREHISAQQRVTSSGSSKMSESQLRILESGWLRDSDGKWVKDPNVEFDSDEEPPE